MVSLPQPLAAVLMMMFVTSFEHYLLSSFSHDSFSIRVPTATSNLEYCNHKGGQIRYKPDFKESNGTELIERSGSYFSLRPFHTISSLYSSKKFKAIFNQFPVHGFLDYRDCFGSIYTHEFSWLNTSEGHEGILHTKAGFFSIVDKVCEAVNAEETSGVIVGPEFSRCMVEILLERIDQDVIFRLLSQFNLVKGKDYFVFRFVDDHFLFAKDLAVMNLLIDEIRECALAYHLHVNETKTISTNFLFSFESWVPEIAACAKQFSKIFANESLLAVPDALGESLFSFRLSLIKSLSLDGPDIKYKKISYLLSSINSIVHQKHFRENFLKSPKLTAKDLTSFYNSLLDLRAIFLLCKPVSPLTRY